MGANPKPFVGNFSGSLGYGKITGRQSSDGKKGWRLDYDPEKGTHINIWDFSKGKGPDKAVKLVSLLMVMKKILKDCLNI